MVSDSTPYAKRGRALLVEYWEYAETVSDDVPSLLRALADDIESTGAALLAVIVEPELPYVQAVVDTGRGKADA
jgi:hypothetical protein